MSGWIYLSFADDEKFLGGAIVRARDVAEGALVAHALGCNPGGQVLGLPIPVAHLPAARWRERLLTKAELDCIWSDMRRLGDCDVKIDGVQAECVMCNDGHKEPSS